jgi:hypothetical protein
MTRPVNVVNKTEKQAAPCNKWLNWKWQSQPEFMRKIAINQYKNVKSTLKIPDNLIIYLTSHCVFKMEQLIKKTGL